MKSSATTMATTARPMASRMPVMMNGSEAGMTILVKICASLAPSASAISTMPRPTLRTPA